MDGDVKHQSHRASLPTSVGVLWLPFVTLKMEKEMIEFMF